ncbi:MAG: hypothetical protein ABIZ04_00290 [Opitutus sp.]
MSASTPVQITADGQRNILRITFAGNVTSADLIQYRADSMKALEALRPEFTLCVDLTDLVNMDFDCVPYIEQNMELVRDHGVKLVVRIIPDRTKDIGLSIMSLFHYRRGLKMLTVETRAEAEHLLA